MCLPLLLAVSLQAGPAARGVLVKMTPQVIEDVIARTGSQAPRPYRLHNRRAWIQFDTPFLRLARKVAEARAQSLPVTTQAATPDVVSDELRFSVGPEPQGDSDVAVKAIVIERPDGTLVKPLSARKFVDKAQSRGRRSIELAGLEGTFPASALVPGARFRLKMKGAPDQVLAPEPAWFDEPR